MLHKNHFRDGISFMTVSQVRTGAASFVFYSSLRALGSPWTIDQSI